MAKWKLCFALLLPLCFAAKEETLSKLIEGEPDVTPICTNTTQSIITLIVCNIRTKSRGEECQLLYQYQDDFKYTCDSRFTLMTDSQTVFLHLSSLTPGDSGNYTCECTYPNNGTDNLYLNITVAAENTSSNAHNQLALIGATIIFLILTGVILGLILTRIRHRRPPPEPQSNLANTEPEDIEPYSTFTRRESGLYSIVRLN